MAPNLLQACRQLSDVQVDDEVADLHKTQVEALASLAASFLQNAKQTQSSHTRIAHLEERFQKVDELEASLQRAHSEIGRLQQELTLKDKQLNDRIDTTNADVRETESRLQGEIAETAQKTIGQMRKEMESMLQKVTGSIDKMEKNLKKCQKLANQNKDKIGLAVRKVEETVENMSRLKKQTERQIKELTASMKEQMDFLVHEVRTFKEEVTGKMQEAAEKFSAFQFETINSLARKADIDDLAKKFDIVAQKEFAEQNRNEHEALTATQNELDAKLSSANEDRADLRRTAEGGLDTATQERQQLMTVLNKMRNQIDGAASPAELCAELKVQMVAHTEEVANELREEMKNALMECGMLQQPAFSSSSGNCFSCGKPMSTAFSPLPKRKPMSPMKSPGGGFNSRRNSIASPKQKRMSVNSSRSNLLSEQVKKSSPGRKSSAPQAGVDESVANVKLPPITATDSTDAR